MASSIPQSTGIAALISASNNKPPAVETTSIFGEDGFTFGDIIDIVNPLQHIPVVSNIYRKITGDTIAPAMEIAGGALFGGPIGAVTSMLTVAFESYIKSDSTDPDSPYRDNPSDEANNTAIASNSPQALPKAISNNDYEALDNSETNQLTHSSPISNRIGGWVLNSDFINRNASIDKTVNRQVSINTIKSKPVYQPADGIVNLAYKNTENYTDVITSTNTPAKTIDIIIGASSGAG